MTLGEVFQWEWREHVLGCEPPLQEAGRMEQEKDSSVDFFQKPSPASIPVLTALQVFPSHTPGVLL